MTQYLHTDNLTWLRQQPDNSIDSVVTDSPYGLGKEPDPLLVLRDWLDHGYHEIKGKGFMGQKWDAFVPQPALWKEVYRVMKPGAHLLSFFGTRTYDWGVLAIRLAGFEVRDQIAWVYGSGFPKSSNQHSAWEGWGTALKPAMEPIVVCRKPLIGTVPENLQEFGTGAINIDGCRVDFKSDEDFKSATFGTQTDIKNEGYGSNRPSNGNIYAKNVSANIVGRWPANLIHDGSDEVLDVFPDSNGQLASATIDRKQGNNKIYGELPRYTVNPEPRVELDKSSSRFFYCAKPSPYERNRGCENLPKKPGGQRSNTSGQHITRRDGADPDPDPDPDPVGNYHPTVKPIALMRYLVRLITPPQGTCLDPFGGSGTTGIASELEGIACICLDDKMEYVDIAKARAEAWRPIIPPPDPQLDLFL